MLSAENKRIRARASIEQVVFTAQVFSKRILPGARIEVEPIHVELCRDHPSLHSGSADNFANAIIQNQAWTKFRQNKHCRTIQGSQKVNKSLKKV